MEYSLPEADPDSRQPARGNNLEDLRRQNLSAILGLVHANGSLSRADITRATGLNRSTVATIVSELERMDLVVVSEPRDTKRVGRPSTVVGPSERFIAIAVNPDQDAIAIGIVAMGGQVLREFRFPVERIPSARETINTLSAVLQGLHGDLSAQRTVVGIGVAVPGLVGARDGIVRVAPHLAWRDEPIVELMAASTGYPTWAANDATCGVVAEGQFGIAAGEDNVVYLNGGAGGIGGGAILGGQLLSGESGFSGELGHTLVNSNGALCHCGAIGCLETEVSRSALLAAVGLEPQDASRLEERLRAGYRIDRSLTEVVDSQMQYLAVALRNFVNIFNPGLIVLGGFLADLFTVAGERLEYEVASSSLPGPATEVRIVGSTLENNLLIGAAELVLQTVLRDPTSAAEIGRTLEPREAHVAAVR
ncbi:ROK family transcriptional regulator [Microbacterium sp. NPDC019599]|uniref:ROK family transcriptional regulator n=1 Tax=Microbacterium sp. NPDC019599 TaxID=3154690 RepID=UPI00340CFD81